MSHLRAKCLFCAARRSANRQKEAVHARLQASASLDRTLNIERDQTRTNASVGDEELPDGHRQGKSTRSGAAGVNVPDAISLVDSRTVRVARDDSVKPGGYGVDI